MPITMGAEDAISAAMMECTVTIHFANGSILPLLESP
jgi:hypothetical protein